MKRERQVSAFVSDETNQRLDMYVQDTGLKKSRAIEDAIVAYLDAFDALPASMTIPTRIVLTKESGERFLQRLAEEPHPTEALIQLIRDHRDRA